MTEIAGDSPILVFDDTRIVRWFYHIIPVAVLFLCWEVLARVVHQPHILPLFSAVATSENSHSKLTHPIY